MWLLECTSKGTKLASLQDETHPRAVASHLTWLWGDQSKGEAWVGGEAGLSLLITL